MEAREDVGRTRACAKCGRGRCREALRRRRSQEDGEGAGQ